VRIIGGLWRGRRLQVADAPGLRPSGDRARETLFNWLQPTIRGARCADLFAGTGALGFEAASRGAGEVVLVEKSDTLVASLRHSAEALGAEQVKIVESDALGWLGTRPPGTLDLVFLDPPFDTDLGHQALNELVRSGSLSGGATVYFESARLDPIRVHKGFLQAREKLVGEVRMQLLHWRGDD